MLQTHAERAALKRNVTVEEVGNSALFLCSDLSSGITGEILYVDAGYRFMGVNELLSQVAPTRRGQGHLL